MKTYELTYIVSPEITSQEAEAKAKEIESAVQSREGVILKQSNPIAKALSYPIKKRASGFFGILEFQLEPEKLIELKEILQKDGKIVRHMVIIKEAAEFKKERRTRSAARVKTEPDGFAGFGTEQKTTDTEASAKTTQTSPADKSESKGKVELKDIEQKLDEILGE